jgi:hypothetical protein
MLAPPLSLTETLNVIRPSPEVVEVIDGLVGFDTIEARISSTELQPKPLPYTEM